MMLVIHSLTEMFFVRKKILFTFIFPMWAWKTDVYCENNGARLPSSKLRWWLSGYCHILLSNTKLCIQFEQPTASPIVPDFKAWIMTLKGQLKQASLFFYSGAYAAGNPLKSSIDSLSYPKNKVWMLWLMDIQPLSLCTVVCLRQVLSLIPC